MSLATRCTACGTVFRVVLDQLRVSEGWVRCGRCDAVFDATEALFDIDSGAPLRLQAAAPEAAATLSDASAAAAAPPLDGAATQPGLDEDAAAFPLRTAPAAPQEPQFADPPPAWDDTPYDPRDEPLLRAPSRGGDDDPAPEADRIIITDHEPGEVLETPAHARGLAPDLTAEPAALAVGHESRIDPQLSDIPAQSQAAPSFIRDASRSQGWRRPALLLGLWTAALLLTLAAALQAALLWRDALAAGWPAAKPALAQLCRLAACSVQPPRRIDALSVDSSSLNRLEGAALYRLQLVLRNQGSSVVMLPALDLSLNDGQGQLVARRVLATADLGLRETALAPGQSLPVSAVLSTGGRRVDGYTLELFYP